MKEELLEKYRNRVKKQLGAEYWVDYLFSAIFAAAAIHIWFKAGLLPAIVMALPAVLHLRLVMLRFKYISRAAEALAYAELLMSVESGEITLDQLRQQI